MARWVVPGTIAGVDNLPPELLPAPDPVLLKEPGGPVVRTFAGTHGAGTATFSADLQHRYRLSRVWDPTLPRCVFVMLNPSTATEAVLDPTIRRCYGYATTWGAGALEVVNIFALRSTDPGALYRHHDPVGAGNDTAVVAAACAGDLVVAGWGAHGALRNRGACVRALLADTGVELHQLRLTNAGHPGHPLYLRADAEPLLWPVTP